VRAGSGARQAGRWQNIAARHHLRNVLAVLALIGVGLDPRRLATSHKAGELSEQLGLHVAGFGRTDGIAGTGGCHRARTAGG
jgi:hypothetical protein